MKILCTLYSSPETVTATLHLLGVNECCGEYWESPAALGCWCSETPIWVPTFLGVLRHLSGCGCSVVPIVGCTGTPNF